MIVFFNTIRMLENEISSANISLLTHLQRIFEDQIHQAEELSLQINWNTQIKELMNTKGKLTKNEHYVMTVLIRDFKAYKAKSFIDSFYIHFNSSGVILGDT